MGVRSDLCKLGHWLRYLRTSARNNYGRFLAFHLFIVVTQVAEESKRED